MSEEAVDVLRVMDRDTELHLALRNDPEANEESWNTRAIVAELIAADREYDDAQFGLARARYNGEPLDPWVSNCAKADIRRAAILARIKD